MSRASQADRLPLTQVLFLVLGEKEGGCLTSADCILVELQTNLRINLDGVPSSIMRKFIYKSGRTQSAQGRETCP